MEAALKTANGEFEVKDVETPKIPKPDWLLATVRVAGIWGTDLRHWKKEEPHLEHKIMGNLPGNADVLDLVAKGKLNAKKLITHNFPLAQINKAFETANRKDETGAIFVVLTI